MSHTSLTGQIKPAKRWKIPRPIAQYILKNSLIRKLVNHNSFTRLNIYVLLVFITIETEIFFILQNWNGKKNRWYNKSINFFIKTLTTKNLKSGLKGANWGLSTV